MLRILIRAISSVVFLVMFTAGHAQECDSDFGYSYSTSDPFRVKF